MMIDLIGANKALRHKAMNKVKIYIKRQMAIMPSVILYCAVFRFFFN